MKLTDLLKELGIEEGKVYTDKDRPPFKVVEGGPGSGPHGDDDDKEDNPFDREPSDDELKDIEKQFEGTVFEGIDLYQEACWKGYEKKGMKKMFGKMYPNCVKKKKRKSEGKLAEGKKLRLPGGVEATIDFKGIKLQQKGKKPVFLDRNELLNFFRATTKYLRYT